MRPFPVIFALSRERSFGYFQNPVDSSVGDADVSDRPEISGAGSNSVLWLIELFRRVPCLQSL